MSASSNSVSSSASGNFRGKNVGEGERGMPRTCRCGNGSVIRTSGTVKNPGRLFHCCPNGSEGDKFHLFKWTDECVVEEIEDFKSVISELKRELEDLKSVVRGYHGQIEDLKTVVANCEGATKECSDEIHSFKKMMMCGIGFVALCLFLLKFVSFDV